MLRGDLSNAVPKKMLFVFEGLVGRLTTRAAQQKASWFLTAHQYRRAVHCYEIDRHTKAVLWDLRGRYDMQFDVVTINGQGFADALEHEMDKLSIPFQYVHSFTPDKLAQELTFMPYVWEVVHANPEWQLKFGPKGHYVSSTKEFFL